MNAFINTTYNGTQITGERNDCAVRALMTTTGATYLAAHNVLRNRCGRQFRRGTSTYSLTTLLDSGTILGAAFTRVDSEGINGNWQTLAAFKRSNPVGRFYLLMRGHAFAVVNGVTIDTWKVGSRSRVNGAWAVTPVPAGHKLVVDGPLRANTIAKLVAAYNAAPTVDGAKVITAAHLVAAGLGASWAKTPASVWANSPRHQHALRVWGATSAVCSKSTITVR